MPPTPGDDVRVVMSKWERRPHWEFDALALGDDEQGTWLGLPAGSEMHRPGVTYVAPTDQVVLVPGPGDDPQRHWVATFHDVAGPVRVYVDITTPPVWEGAVARAVDLDLDVICGPTGRVWVDDEDEFARHRVELAYPDDLVRAALDSCERVRAAVAAGAAPYDGRATRWLARLRHMLLG